MQYTKAATKGHKDLITCAQQPKYKKENRQVRKQ